MKIKDDIILYRSNYRAGPDGRARFVGNSESQVSNDRAVLFGRHGRAGLGDRFFRRLHLALDPATLNGSMTYKQEGIMTIANVSQGSAGGLSQALRTAQEAIHLPEVQAMLDRLSEYHFGIFMPHMHDEQTGEFRPLPDEVMQVESGLEVSFQPTHEIANQTDRFLPVGWFWRAGASTPSAVCEMAREERPGDTERDVKHKMPKGN